MHFSVSPIFAELDANYNEVSCLQFLATSAVYLNLFDMGMALGFPTIMLPALRSGEESVMFNEGQASWFGKFLRLSSFKI